MTTAAAEMPLARRNGDDPAKKKMASIKDLFEAARNKIAQVAPKHMSPDRMMRVALMTISRTPALAQCTPHSLLNAFMTASQLGLEIGGVLGEAYLVPYKTEATFILGYRGMINLARRSGQIQSIEAQVVREGDHFEFEYGLETRFRHKPMTGPGAPISYAWALARFKDGGHQLDVMTIDEINAVRKRSRASSNGPWVTDFAEMAKKTVVRRLAKYLPLSPEERDAIEASDKGEFGEFIDVKGEVVEAEQKHAKKKADRLADALDDTPTSEGEEPAPAPEASAEQEKPEPPSDEPSEAPDEIPAPVNYGAFRLAAATIGESREQDTLDADATNELCDRWLKLSKGVDTSSSSKADKDYAKKVKPEDAKAWLKALAEGRIDGETGSIRA